MKRRTAINVLFFYFNMCPHVTLDIIFFMSISLLTKWLNAMNTQTLRIMNRNLLKPHNLESNRQHYHIHVSFEISELHIPMYLKYNNKLWYRVACTKSTGFGGVRVARSLVFCVMFWRLLVVLLSFFFCQFVIFDKRILITSYIL